MQAEQKVVIVTGASQGIGAGLVAAYRARGYGVVANSRAITPAFAAGDAGIVTVDGDIGSSATADRVAAAALERFGRIDSLINNAGIFLSKPFIEYTETDFVAAIAVNVAGFFHITQRAAVQMLKQKSGHIVQITASMVGQPLKEVPGALASLTKGGLATVTRGLAIEFADRGVRVNAVAPGITKTPMHSAETYEALAKLHPMHRMAEISEVVDAVLYLESALFVTGETIHVDGGQNAGHW
jgi:NAD(P)-dependent dehydrogenase (short-subunit alcohol dehydrogenase family)